MATKLSLPELPAEYPNLRACSVYAGADEQKSPRQHLGEPIYLAIEKSAEESQKRLRIVPWLWGVAAAAFVTCFAGFAAGWPTIVWAIIGLTGLGIFARALNLARKRYEPSVEALLALAENEDQKSFLLEIDGLRSRLALGPVKGGAYASETLQSAWGGDSIVRQLRPSIFACDHALLLLIKEKGFEALRTRQRKPTGRITIHFSTIAEPIDISSRSIVLNKNPKHALSQIAWLRQRAENRGDKAAGFREMLDIMEGLVKYRGWSLEAIAAQLQQDGVPKASLEYVKKLNSGHPTPFSTYLKHIDLTEFPATHDEAD